MKAPVRRIKLSVLPNEIKDFNLVSGFPSSGIRPPNRSAAGISFDFEPKRSQLASFWPRFGPTCTQKAQRKVDLASRGHAIPRNAVFPISIPFSLPLFSSPSSTPLRLAAYPAGAGSVTILCSMPGPI